MREYRLSPLKPLTGFTLVELLVVIGIMAALMVFAIPAFNNINGSTGLTAAINNVSEILELARAQAMATRSYVYVGFANTTNADGNDELRIGAVISIDGSSNTSSANLKPLTRLVKVTNVLMTNYSNLPSAVQAATDTTLQNNSDYVITFSSTSFLSGQFNDTAFNTCPTVVISPQGEVLQTNNPNLFYAICSVGIVPTHRTTAGSTDGAVVTYYGGTGQLRITRPRA